MGIIGAIIGYFLGVVSIVGVAIESNGYYVVMLVLNMSANLLIASFFST